MERVRRVELPTLCLASIRSSQLSYTRVENFLQEALSVVNFIFHALLRRRKNCT